MTNDLFENYLDLGDTEKKTLVSAANDSNRANRLSIARLYFPGAPVQEIERLLSRIQRL